MPAAAFNEGLSEGQDPSVSQQPTSAVTLTASQVVNSWGQSLSKLRPANSRPG